MREGGALKSKFASYSAPIGLDESGGADPTTRFIGSSRKLPALFGEPPSTPTLWTPPREGAGALAMICASWEAVLEWGRIYETIVLK